jgi:predicted peptidase
LNTTPLMQMTFLTTLLLSITFCFNALSSDKPQDKFQKAASFKYQPKPVELNYLHFLPQGYDAKSDKKWPMIFFLHGAGERGSDVWRVSVHGPAKYIVQHSDFPFILISPQCPDNATWNDDALLALLDDVEKKFNVDTNRVYLTGLSMGGFGTWSLGMRHPDRFAAVAPICGGGQSIFILLAAKGFAPDKWAYMKQLPIWVFHGAKDKVVPIAESEHMVKMLEACGADMSKVKFTIYPEATHDSWTETYNNPEFYKWLLEQERKPQSVPKK